jgi:hypothetical protein
MGHFQIPPEVIMTNNDVIEPDLPTLLVILLKGEHSTIDAIAQLMHWHPTRVHRALGRGLYDVPALITDLPLGRFALTEEGHALALSLADDRS